MKYLYALLLLLLALVLAAFIQQNGQDVALKYFHWRTVPLPLSLLMILAFAGGYGLALVLGFSSGIRNRVRLAGAKKEVKQLMKELQGLREQGEKGSGEGESRDDRTKMLGTRPGAYKGEPEDSVGLSSEGGDGDNMDDEERGGKGGL